MDDKSTKDNCLTPLLEAGCKSGFFSKFKGPVSAGKSLCVSGMSGSAISYLLALTGRTFLKPIIFIASGAREAGDFVEDMKAFGAGNACLFPAWETLPGEESEPHPDIVGDRFMALAGLLEASRRGFSRLWESPVVATTMPALFRKIIRPESLEAEMLRLSAGAETSMEDLLAYLEKGGYRREEMVEIKGEYAVRGGIVDLFPPADDYPLRLEFIGDELATVRKFHSQTQRTISTQEKVVITPCSEISLLKRRRAEPGSLLDYLPEDTLVAVQEPGKTLSVQGEAGSEGESFFPAEQILELIRRRQTINISLLPWEPGGEWAGDKIQMEFQTLEQYRALDLGTELGGEWRSRIFEHIGEWLENGFRTALLCNNEGEAQRLRELLKEKGIVLPQGSCLCVGRMSSGFIEHGDKIAMVTDAELFGRYRVRRPRRRFKGTVAVREFSDLRPGDHVVHVRQGIGVYRGVTKLAKDGSEKDYLCLEYKDKAKLYVPLEHAGLVERYIGIGGAAPPLDKLGGARWQGARIAAQKAIFDYAAEILQLQAERSLKEGHAFPPDTAWQKEFEDAFIYEETPDQAIAIEDVKRDMEKPHPMDRLICGDVGYGKTEVAIRAAFKVVMDGKQAAVLVPTTVLAQQHLQTFSDRCADYPVRIEMLSRFRTAGEQGAIIRGLREGKVDIVIGTHRLLQPDVAFNDLGLVIIDEEQRFGVKNKERLKKLRLTVDVLTMTATPIPRTLYMSLAGIRDMSTINTPPEDRLAIKTVVSEYNRELVKSAIRRELERQGQVYFVHNRVETIDWVMKSLQELVPEASYAIGHGQMSDGELEEVMGNFVEGNIQVLVCTTIIESGLDIPNANTIIIDHAERFGLADLYQLRGRVGRYKRRAYAYMLYRDNGVLADVARKRLKAIMEHPGLGAGFKIALRDLEIRGAGNILGAEQHGHVAAIGFDLYCKLLRRSIDRLKGKEANGIEDIELNLPLGAELSAGYIPSEIQRIDLYKRLGEITCRKELDDLAEEIEDRFGPLPESASLLLEMYELKLTARDRGIRALALQDDKLIAVRQGEEIRPEGRYPRVTKKQPRALLNEIKKIIGKL